MSDATRFLDPSEVSEELEQKITRAAEAIATDKKLEVVDAPNQAPVWYVGGLQVSLVHHDGDVQIAVYHPEHDTAALLPSSASSEEIQEIIEEGLNATPPS